jgi:hypothetical protein
MSPEDRAAMWAVTTGVDEAFDNLPDEQKDIVFREMLAVRRTMVMYAWMIANCHARVRKRGPKALARALQQILSLRDTSVMAAVQHKLPSDILWKTPPCFEMLEEMLEACDRLDDDTEDRYDPSESEMAAQAQFEEADCLRGVLDQVGVYSYALIGKMVGFTSGREISARAIEIRFASPPDRVS